MSSDRVSSGKASLILKSRFMNCFKKVSHPSLTRLPSSSLFKAQTTSGTEVELRGRSDDHSMLFRGNLLFLFGFPFLLACFNECSSRPRLVVNLRVHWGPVQWNLCSVERWRVKSARERMVRPHCGHTWGLHWDNATFKRSGITCSILRSSPCASIECASSFALL